MNKRSRGYFTPEYYKRVFWSHRDTLVWNKIMSSGNSRIVLRDRLANKNSDFRKRLN